jgi:hypothetical protein
MWNKEISDYLISIGFTQLIPDTCIFGGMIGGDKVFIRRCNHWGTEPKDHATRQVTH